MATNTAAISVDVDDLLLALGDFNGLPQRNHQTGIRTEMKRLVRLLADHAARCTFFVPGYILRARPDALDGALEDGHEVACHGHRHVPVYRHVPVSFEEDLGTAVDLIRRATGRTPIGYRAPGMTLFPVADWATPILRRNGFRYSSSLPGLALGQHKFQKGNPLPFHWPCGLVELPVSTQPVCGLRIPVCGSIYTRLLPHTLIKYATNRFSRESAHPLFYYLHPFEVFPENLQYNDFRRHWKLRLYIAGCRGFLRKFEWILARFSCVTYVDALDQVSVGKAV